MPYGHNQNQALNVQVTMSQNAIYSTDLVKKITWNVIYDWFYHTFATLQV